MVPMPPASDDFAVNIRPTSRLRRLSRWVLNLSMATSAEGAGWFSVWPNEAVISDRRTGKVVRVVRNDSSGAEDAVADVAQDVHEMSAEAFRKTWT